MTNNYLLMCILTFFPSSLRIKRTTQVNYRRMKAACFIRSYDYKSSNTYLRFYIFLTVRLRIILVVDKLDAQFLL